MEKKNVAIFNDDSHDEWIFFFCYEKISRKLFKIVKRNIPWKTILRKEYISFVRYFFLVFNDNVVIFFINLRKRLIKFIIILSSSLSIVYLQLIKTTTTTKFGHIFIIKLIIIFCFVTKKQKLFSQENYVISNHCFDHHRNTI